jgi:hypothetical protein
LAGDNVVNRTNQMPWYDGPTLLQHLETVPARPPVHDEPARFPVQYVIRPDAGFRGFAGQVASGTIRPGDRMLALPSGQDARVRTITTYDGEQQEVFSPMSVTLTLDREIDLSRGDMLVSPEQKPSVSRVFKAMVVWFHADPLALGRTYLIKHNVRMSRAKATQIDYRVNMQTLEREPASELHMNDIAAVEFETAAPLLFDSYHQNRATGSFILIDPISNATVGAAMIDRGLSARVVQAPSSSTIAERIWKPVAAEDRYARHGHLPAIFLVEGRPRLAGYLERALFAEGFEVLLVPVPEVPPDNLLTLLGCMQKIGLIVILSTPFAEPSDKAAWRTVASERFFDLTDQGLPSDEAEVVRSLMSLAKSLRVERAWDDADEVD